MKKILSILLMLLMVISIMPLALAEEETEDVEVDEETEEEIVVMNTGLGAEVRLLQLEKAITRNILRGQEVIAKAKEAEKDVSELEAIIAEMETLKTEVQEADPESENSVKEFVDLKSDGIELSKNFRGTARALLKSEEITQLRNRIKERNIGEQTNLTQKIREKIRAFNAEQLQKMCGILGIEDSELIDKFENGEVKLNEVKTQIKEQFRAMTQEERKESFAQLKEEGVKRNVFRKAAVQKAKLNFLVRKETRLTKRLNQVDAIKDPEKRDKLQNMISNRLRVISKQEIKTISKIQAQQKIKSVASVSAKKGGEE